MSEKIIFKEKSEKAFWRYWQEYINQNKASPKYLKLSLEYNLINSSGSSLLVSDKSFVYLVDNKVVGCVFLPIERNDGFFTVSSKGGYVDAPLFEDNKKIEENLFDLIDKIVLENKVSKIMFSIDPLEKDRFTYNYLQKYDYLDTSMLAYLINTCPGEDLLGGCRKGHRRSITYVLKNKDFKVFFTDENNPSYETHKEYELLHHKCSGKKTRPKETFDLQFGKLKQGKAVLFGLKYKDKNIAYCYFEYNINKALHKSAADDPDYDKLPLYHILMYSAMKYFQERGVDYIDTSPPFNPSIQYDYYPDEKQLNIGYFKRGFGGEFVDNFRGIKYLSKEIFKKDTRIFSENYTKTIQNNINYEEGR